MDLFVEPFDWWTYLEDRWQIEKAVYESRNVGQEFPIPLANAGPLPLEVLDPTPAGCPGHWAVPFGLFVREEGPTSGEAMLAKRLLAWIFPERFGDMIYIPDVVARPGLSGPALDLLLRGFIETLRQGELKWQTGVNIAMFSSIENTAAKDLDVLYRLGFEPMRISAGAAIICAAA